MTGTGIVVMVVVLGFVWGGFALILGTAAGKERAKKGKKKERARE